MPRQEDIPFRIIPEVWAPLATHRKQFIHTIKESAERAKYFDWKDDIFSGKDVSVLWTLQLLATCDVSELPKYFHEPENPTPRRQNGKKKKKAMSMTLSAMSSQSKLSRLSRKGHQ